MTLHEAITGLNYQSGSSKVDTLLYRLSNFEVTLDSISSRLASALNTSDRSLQDINELKSALRSFQAIELLENLRTTTKFTTTTSINRERTGMRTSVSAGKNELKKRSRSTTSEMRTARYGFF